MNQGRLLVLGLMFSSAVAMAHSGHVQIEANPDMRFVQIEANDKYERSEIANMGVSIEAVRTGSVWGFANLNSIEALKKAGKKILGDFSYETGRGGHETFDFPAADARFHNYAEVTATLRNLQGKNADIARVTSIGKSIENRDIWAIHINTDPEALMSGKSSKPGVIYMGNHHAREHLSVEMPLMWAEHLLQNRTDSRTQALLESRDIWIIPMVNPDGSEWDISTTRYKMWRKNRRDNKNGTFGVDLNRNYGFKWGTGGSSKDTSSDVYMGVQPFSEPETQAIRDFVSSQTNCKVLLTIHTFSELILYPWGHTHDDIGNAKDFAVFKKMATTMAGWNKYKPQSSSDLYIASGDTTDWAYGERGIFAFTFELSPSAAGGGFGGGGFYPGAGAIDSTFAANVKPFTYLLEVADDPYKVLDSHPTGFLKHYVEPKVTYESMWKSL